jgi:hypothetical protein
MILLFRGTTCSTEDMEEDELGRTTIVVLEGEPGRGIVPVLEEEDTTYHRRHQIYPHVPHA